MSTRSTTAIIDRREDPNGEVVVSYYRHWDGYPRGNGKDLVELILDIVPVDPKDLIKAIEARWYGQDERGPHVERTRSHASHCDTEFRYDVIYEVVDERPVVSVECRHAYGATSDDDWPLEDGDEWLAQAARLDGMKLPLPAAVGEIGNLSRPSALAL